MVQNPCLEINSLSSGQENLCRLLNPNRYFRVDKMPQLDPV